MNRKTILISIIAFLLITITGVFVYLYFQNRTPHASKEINQDSFALTYTYKGNNQWEYTVTGTLPTPCVQVSTDAIVMESYPEQVKIQVKRQESSTTDVCITMIKDYSYTGTFSASSKAVISLSIE